MGAKDLQSQRYYVGKLSRLDVNACFMKHKLDGSFVVRDSQQLKGEYVLTLYSNTQPDSILDYRITKNSPQEFYIQPELRFPSIPELIEYHLHSKGGLRACLNNTLYIYGIRSFELQIKEKLGAGSFGVVKKGILRGSIPVAIKMLNAGMMTESEFIAEGKTMLFLIHPNVVMLRGICTEQSALYIITEYMKHGALYNYLRINKALLKLYHLLQISKQICAGMKYLESKNMVHRDLAARNCLVGEGFTFKVADFGLTRFVPGDHYTNANGIFATRWASPEALRSRHFSSKSDVWAFGILMWEIYSYGQVPYGQMTDAAVCNAVLSGKVLSRIAECPINVDQIMRKCWIQAVNDRPSFQQLQKLFEAV